MGGFPLMVRRTASMQRIIDMASVSRHSKFEGPLQAIMQISQGIYSRAAPGDNQGRGCAQELTISREADFMDGRIWI